MSTGERYCSKCGTKGDEGASFCGKCGAFIGEAPPAPPVAPPPQPQMRTVERRYPRWDLRDLDMKSMSSHGWVVMAQSQEPGGYLRVTYGTTAPPGQAALPAQVQVKQGAKPTRVLALIGGVVLLLVCVGLAMSANAGKGEAADPKTKIAFEGHITRSLAVEQPGTLEVSVSNTGEVPVKSLAIFIPNSLLYGMVTPRATGCSYLDVVEGFTFYCGNLPAGSSRTITIAYLGSSLGSHIGDVIIADQAQPTGKGSAPSSGQTLGRLSSYFSVTIP